MIEIVLFYTVFGGASIMSGCYIYNVIKNKRIGNKEYKFD